MSYLGIVRRVSIMLDKTQSVNLINTVLKNIGANEFLSEDIDKKGIEKVAESLCNLKFAKSDFINDQNAHLYYILGASLVQDDTKQKEQYRDIDISSIEYKSDSEIIIKLWDSMSNDGKYSWLYVAYNIDCKEFAVDELEFEHKRCFEFMWHIGTHFIRKENGNFHYDYYSAENYEKLMEEGVHEIHFGENILYDLDNELFNLNIEFECAEGSYYNEVYNIIKKKENEIEIIKQKLAKILGIEKSNIYGPTEKLIAEYLR